MSRIKFKTWHVMGEKSEHFHIWLRGGVRRTLGVILSPYAPFLRRRSGLTGVTLAFSLMRNAAASAGSLSTKCRNVRLQIELGKTPTAQTWTETCSEPVSWEPRLCLCTTFSCPWKWRGKRNILPRTAMRSCYEHSITGYVLLWWLNGSVEGNRNIHFCQKCSLLPCLFFSTYCEFSSKEMVSWITKKRGSSDDAHRNISGSLRGRRKSQDNYEVDRDVGWSISANQRTVFAF